jgi:hypothetical protein
LVVGDALDIVAPTTGEFLRRRREIGKEGGRDEMMRGGRQIEGASVLVKRRTKS